MKKVSTILVFILMVAMVFALHSVENAKAASVPLSQKGGAIIIESGATYTFRDSIISGKSKERGGAIYISSGATLIMESGTIEGCTATYGGGIYVEAGATCTITGGTIKNCKATFGPAIYIEAGANFSCTSPDINPDEIIDANQMFHIGTIPSGVSVKRNGVEVVSNSEIYANEILEITYDAKENYFVDCNVTGAVSLGENKYRVIGDIEITYSEQEATNGKLIFTQSGDHYMVRGTASARDDVVIPSYYNGLPVTEIEVVGFLTSYYITSVSIPSTVTTIGAGAFSSCYALKSVNIPNGVTVIQRDTFNNCTALTGINIPDSVVTIEDGAFFGCKISKLTIGDSLATVSSVFSGFTISELRITASNCPDFTSDTSPFNMSSSAKVTFSSNVKRIPGYLFKNPKNVKTLEIEEGVKSIGSHAFYECTGLTSLTIPKSVETIEDYAFYHCSGIGKLVIGPNLASVGYLAFAYNDTSSIIVDTNNKRYTSRDGSGRECNVLVDTTTKTLLNGSDGVVIPSDGSVTSIDDYAFYYCHTNSDYTVIIPDEIITIGKCAFVCYHMSTVKIGNGLQSIGEKAFINSYSNYNYKIKTVYYHGKSAGWNKLKANIATGNDELLNASLSYISTSLFAPENAEDTQVKVEKNTKDHFDFLKGKEDCEFVDNKKFVLKFVKNKK